MVQEQSLVLYSRTECRQAQTVNGMLRESYFGASDFNGSFIIHDENLQMQTNEIFAGTHMAIQLQGNNRAITGSCQLGSYPRQNRAMEVGCAERGWVAGHDQSD